MEAVKERTLISGQKVRVYLNWNKGHCTYSILDHKSGLVVAYASSVLLHNATFRVSSAGRRRVLESGHKNVHAWVSGTFIEADTERPSETSIEVYYDPHKVSSFVAVGRGNVEILSSPVVHLSQRRAWIPEVVFA